MLKGLFLQVLLSLFIPVSAWAQSCFFPGNDTSWQTGFVGNGVLQTQRISAMVPGPDGLYCLFESPVGLGRVGGAHSISVVNKWNGKYWEPVGPAFPYTGSAAVLRSMVMDSDGNLIIGGSFTTPASLSSNCIVKLNLSTLLYEPVGMGISSPSPQNHLLKMAIYHDTLYVLGRFSEVRDSSGSKAVRNIARFYLKSHRWDSVGSGISDFIPSYANTWIPLCGMDISPSGEVFIGGNFTNIGSNSYYNGIASWKSGRGWDSVGTGLRWWNGNTASRGIAYSLAYNDADSCIYVGGYVGYLANAPTGKTRQSGIARFKNGKWEYDFGSFTAGIHFSFYDSTSKSVFYGGSFGKSLGMGLAEANMIARFDRSMDSMMELNRGITSGLGISCITRWQGKLYVSGDFNEVDSNTSAHNIAAWNGTHWETIGNGLDALNTSTVIHALTHDKKGNTIIAGQFVSAGGKYCNGWARIDSNLKTTPINTGLQAASGTPVIKTVLCLNDSVFILGGRFNRIGSFFSLGIMGYNETSGTWFRFGNSGVSSSSEYINSIVKLGNLVVAGGYFSSINGVAANNLAYWDGSQWHAMGNPNGEVEHMSVLGDSVLYIEGYFSNINGNTYNYLAKYHNGQWSNVGAGLNQSPENIAVNPLTGELWITYTGSIPVSGGPTFNSSGYAVWNGNTWKDYGSVSTFGSSLSSIYHHTDGTTYLGIPLMTAVNGNNANALARYHPSYGWAGLGSGIKRVSSPFTVSINGLLVNKNHVFAAGIFDMAGNNIQSLNLAAYTLDDPSVATAYLSIGPDTSAFYGYSLKANASQNYDSLYWSNGSYNTTYINVGVSGRYIATIYNKGCKISDTANITIKGKNIYKGNSGDGFTRGTVIHNGVMPGGNGDGLGTANILQYSTMPGGNGDGSATDNVRGYGLMPGGNGHGQSSGNILQYAGMPGGMGDGGGYGHIVTPSLLFKGGSGDGFSMNIYEALPDGIIKKIISPLSFAGKDSADLSLWVSNQGDYPILGFTVNWFTNGNLYTQKIVANDTIYPGDSIAVKADKKFMPAIGLLPMDICALVSDIHREKDMLNNRLCYILDKTSSLTSVQGKRTDLKVYPNPATNTAWLEIIDGDGSYADFELVNSEGKQVYSLHLENTEQKIPMDLFTLTPGIYYFVFTQGGNRITGKIAILK